MGRFGSEAFRDGRGKADVGPGGGNGGGFGERGARGLTDCGVAETGGIPWCRGAGPAGWSVLVCSEPLSL